MALWWRRKVDFLRSYLLVSFGQVINNLTSLTFFKRLANEFLVTVLEYEQIFFFFQMLLKSTWHPCLNLKRIEKIEGIWPRCCLQMTKTRSRSVLSLQEKFDIFLLEFQVWQKIANNTSGSSKANCLGLKFNPVDF